VREQSLYPHDLKGRTILKVMPLTTSILAMLILATLIFNSIQSRRYQTQWGDISDTYFL